MVTLCIALQGRVILEELIIRIPLPGGTGVIGNIRRHIKDRI